MKVTVLGATGSVGSRVVTEALSRGHDVIAVNRNHSDDIPDGAEFRIADATNPDQIAELIQGQDVVISAIRPPSGDEKGSASDTTEALLRGMRKTDVRLLAMGGAATLVVPDSGGRTVIEDANYLSPEFRHVGQASVDQLEVFRAETEVDWAYLSPSATFKPGTRIGSYRMGKDKLLVDAEGNSKLSMEDAAVALLDEAEKPKHHRERFTVGY